MDQTCACRAAIAPDPTPPADYRPDVEIHTNEADLFYVIEGRATQVLGGTRCRWKADGARTDSRIEDRRRADLPV